MLLTLSPETVKSCQINFPFNWAKETITYLGIRIPIKLSDLLNHNFENIGENAQRPETMGLSKCLLVQISTDKNDHTPMLLDLSLRPFVEHAQPLLGK